MRAHRSPFLPCAALFSLPLGLHAQTTIAQFDFTVTGDNYTVDDEGGQTIAVGSLFFRDDDSLLVKIANTSTAGGYLTGFYIIDPDYPTGAPDWLTATAEPTPLDPGYADPSVWNFYQYASSEITGSGSPIKKGGPDENYEQYFSTEIQGSPLQGIVNDPVGAPNYHYFTYTFTNLDVTTIEDIFANPDNELPTIAVRWKSMYDGGSDKGYFYDGVIIIVPEPRVLGLLAIPFLGLLLSIRRRR